jgi:SAM-dependent methyltransferase
MVDYQQYREFALEVARTQDLLRIVPKNRQTVLDIGARDGHFSKLLTEHFASVTALDLKKPSFDFPKIISVAGDVRKLDFPDNAFDCVFCTEVLEHIPEVEQACREIIRVARHEIVIGVPFQQDIRVGRTTCGSCGRVNPPWGHVNSFNERTLSALFSGLRLLSKSFVGTSREATNPLSMYLMDFAGNPWANYEDHLECIYCGAGLVWRQEQRTLVSKICSKVAHSINRLQTMVTRPHGWWIHLVFEKS